MPNDLTAILCVGLPTITETTVGRRYEEENPDAVGSTPDHVIATLRPDGWPQTTTVDYVNEGFTLYFLCGLDSPKAANLSRDDRVSLTIDRDTPDIMTITDLSMAAHAQAVVDRAEAEKALHMLPLKYLEHVSSPMPMPTPDDVRIFRVTPTVISVLDYSKGFGHTDLVTC